MDIIAADFANTFQQVLTENIWLSFVFALLAGVVSSFSPCVLSSVPLVIGYVGGYAGNDKAKAVKYSLAFCIGLAATFTALGAVTAILGRMMLATGKWWYLLLGILMAAVGLHLLGVIKILPDQCGVSGGRTTRKGLMGAFTLGILGGILSSPCATPVLIAILTFVAGQGNIVWGIGLLGTYAIGHCTLLFLAGTSVGIVQNLASSPNTERFGKILKIILGILVLLLAMYMFYLGF